MNQDNLNKERERVERANKPPVHTVIQISEIMSLPVQLNQADPQTQCEHYSITAR